MRLERLWALANVLAARRNDWPLGGLRGVRYVAAEAERLVQSGATDVDPEYKLLSRQAPYGVLGIYGAVAEELRLFADRDAMVLSPDSGIPLAEAFCSGTKMPPGVRTAALGEGTVSIEALAKWGESAYLSGPHPAAEAACLGDALVRDPIRARMCDRLQARPFASNETELDRLNAIAAKINRGGPDADLRDAIEVIVAYEEAYSWVLLGFERLLWLCREATVPVSEIARNADPILKQVAAGLPKVVDQLENTLATVSTLHVGSCPTPLADVRKFLNGAAAAAPNAYVVSEVVVGRHIDVQHGKFDRGRRKLPWIERTAGGIALTVTRVGGANSELTSPSQIRPHFYRIAAADAFVAARSPR